jgi:hypothetical protein
VYLLINKDKKSLNPLENLPIVFCGFIGFFSKYKKSVVLSTLRGPLAFLLGQKNMARKDQGRFFKPLSLKLSYYII